MLIRHDHAQTINADSKSRRWWHAVFECTQVIFVEHHGFGISAQPKLELVFKSLSLIERIIKLRKCIANFLAVAYRFKAFHESRLRTVLLRKRTHLNRIIRYKCRLNQVRLAKTAEQ